MLTPFFDKPSDIPPWVERLSRIHQIHLSAHGGTPLFLSGIRFDDSPLRNRNEYLTIREILARGNARCHDIVAWRMAEERLKGNMAFPVLNKLPDGDYHITLKVIDRNGTTYSDPSRILAIRNGTVR